MPDKSDTTNGLEKTEETIFNSDIGDDWGEAFQAEDFMFSPDEEASSGFFLEEDSFDDVIAEEEDYDDLDEELDNDNPFYLAILDKILGLPSLIIALPLKYRIPAIALPLVIFTALFLLLQSSEEPTDQQIVEQDGAEITENGSNEESGQVGENLEPLLIEEVEPPPEKVRKRWKLPSFVISSFNEEVETTALLTIDLTLVLLLLEEETIPSENELFVRDTIFQFFNNRPFSDLKRYTLSRGEMNRSLKSWINKQLPDIPLSSIVFERYQIL